MSGVIRVAATSSMRPYRPPGDPAGEVVELDAEHLRAESVAAGQQQRHGLGARPHATAATGRRRRRDLLDAQVIGVGEVDGHQRELAPEVRVNGVAPGPIMWPEGDSNFDEVSRQRIVSHTMLKRAGDPHDIALAVRFFAMDTHYVTGQILAVDGGRSAKL